jgi:hypothetical protein
MRKQTGCEPGALEMMMVNERISPYTIGGLSGITFGVNTAVEGTSGVISRLWIGPLKRF